MTGNVVDGRNLQYLRYGLTVWTPNRDLISRFHRMSGFRRPAVQQDNARVTKLLGYSAARAKTAEFKEDIKSHAETSFPEAPRALRFRKNP